MPSPSGSGRGPVRGRMDRPIRALPEVPCDLPPCDLTGRKGAMQGGAYTPYPSGSGWGPVRGAYGNGSFAPPPEVP